MESPIPAVIAHRGASAYAPENTLAAFQLAIEQGADGFELDCRLSQDGEVIVIHDATVERTTDGSGPVSGMTLDELRRLDAGFWFAPEFAGQSLPTLDEALELAGDDTRVLIEIKDCDDDRALIAEAAERFADTPILDPTDFCEFMRRVKNSGTRNLALTRAVIERICDHQMEYSATIQSFSPIVCAIVLAELPEIETALLVDVAPDCPEQWELALRGGYLMSVHGFHPNHRLLTPGRLAAFLTADREVCVWLVNDPDDMARFGRWGVSGIITDYPDICR